MIPGIGHIQAATGPVLTALAQLGVRCYIGGSVASSILGVPRTTLDVDVVADLEPGHAAPLAAMLEPDYYISLPAVLEAIARRDSFNLIHFASGMKVDVFVSKRRAYDLQAMDRRLSQMLGDEPNRIILPLASAEDTILAKLAWYRLGHEVSDRQWLDVLNVMKIQAGRLDQAYLDRWAGDLGVADLLRRARAAARL